MFQAYEFGKVFLFGKVPKYCYIVGEEILYLAYRDVACVCACVLGAGGVEIKSDNLTKGALNVLED